MARNVVINGVTYNDVPSVTIPLSGGGGNAQFYDTSSANATSNEIVSGKTAFGANGNIIGTMPNNGAMSGSISTKAQEVSVPAGYHNGSGKVSIAAAEQAKIITDNIKAGTTILGVSGKNTVVDTEISSDAAQAAHIVSGKKAYANGSMITGTLTTVQVSQDSTTKILTVE